MQAGRDRAEVRPLHDRILEPGPQRLRAVRLQHRLRRRRVVRPGDGPVRVSAGRHRTELRPLPGQVRFGFVMVDLQTLKSDGLQCVSVTSWRRMNKPQNRIKKLDDSLNLVLGCVKIIQLLRR